MFRKNTCALILCGTLGMLAWFVFHSMFFTLMFLVLEWFFFGVWVEGIRRD